MPGKYTCGRKIWVVTAVIMVLIQWMWIFPLHLQAQQDQKNKKEIPEEIIKISKLQQEVKEFSIKRNIFSPDPMKPVDPGAAPRKALPPPPPVVKPPEEVKKPDKHLENEIQGSLSYEGYVIKHTKNYALVSMNSEFFAVTTGDMILEKIKIIKIDREAITVEVESQQVEIQIKGDEENEIH
ncbi:MAG: hypothetical protein JSV88_08595 [Candidatus Aminicenantes bacterium]|nr:MAG: hypothetical protein JSV88_08595 [Candidatus Aminicenantes bacterium]